MDRIRRVNEVVQRELGDLFEKMICPHVDSLVTVTQVETTPDLRQANVYVSVYGSADQKKNAMNLIHQQRKEFQRLLSKHVVLKYTPVLHFKLDDIPEKADHVMQILEGLEKEGLNDDE